MWTKKFQIYIRLMYPTLAPPPHRAPPIFVHPRTLDRGCTGGALGSTRRGEEARSGCMAAHSCILDGFEVHLVLGGYRGHILYPLLVLIRPHSSQSILIYLIYPHPSSYFLIHPNPSSSIQIHPHPSSKALTIILPQTVTLYFLINPTGPHYS